MTGTKEEQGAFQQEVQEKLAGDPASASHKPNHPNPPRIRTVSKPCNVHIRCAKQAAVEKKAPSKLSLNEAPGIAVFRTNSVRLLALRGSCPGSG